MAITSSVRLTNQPLFILIPHIVAVKPICAKPVHTKSIAIFLRSMNGMWDSTNRCTTPMIHNVLSNSFSNFRTGVWKLRKLEAIQWKKLWQPTLPFTARNLHVERWKRPRCSLLELFYIFCSLWKYASDVGKSFERQEIFRWFSGVMFVTIVSWKFRIVRTFKNSYYFAFMMFFSNNLHLSTDWYIFILISYHHLIRTEIEINNTSSFCLQ